MALDALGWKFHIRDLALRVPYHWAQGTQTHRRIGLVSYGDGWGEMAPPPHVDWDPDDASRRLADAGRAEDPLGVTDPRLRCAMATASMDHQARQEGLPLSAWLGQRIGRLPAASVEVNALLSAPQPLRLRREAAAAVAEGFRTLKLKIGFGDDLARVAAVREAAPGARLRLDANAGWSPDEAIRQMDALASFDIEYVEQPVAPEERATLRRLTGGPVPVALDESATDPATIHDLRQEGIGDAFILKPQRLGGPDRCLEAMAAADGAPVTVTNSLESAIGLTATLHIAALLPTPTACGLATSRYLAKDVAEPPAIEQGIMQVPQTPGLGVVPR